MESIGSLSEWSAANQSTSKVPDFTNGSWKTNQPLEIQLDNVGNTKIKVVETTDPICFVCS
ncbi:MAG: hypothetical protein ACR2KZ_05520 [Segetibacter sp.]